MAETKKYYHNVDVDKNKIVNLLLNPLTTTQRTAVGTTLTTADQGYVCYDTTLNKPYFWDGTQWVVAGGGSQNLQQVTNIGNTTSNSIIAGGNSTFTGANVGENGVSGYGSNDEDNPGYGVYGQSSWSAGVKGFSNNQSGVFGESIDNTGVYAFSTNGTAIDAHSTNGNHAVFGNGYDGLTVTNSGRTLIGTNIDDGSGAKLQVTGNIRAQNTIHSGTGYAFSIVQDRANSLDLGDTCIALGHKIDAVSLGDELVIRTFALSTENNLTGGGAVSNHRVFNIASFTYDGTKTTDLDQIFIENGGTNGTLGTVTNNRGVYVSNLQGDYQASFVAQYLTAANRTLVRLGGGTLVDGAWSIYSSTNDSSYFRGNLLLGNDADNGIDKLQVNGSGYFKLPSGAGEITIAPNFSELINGNINDGAAFDISANGSTASLGTLNATNEAEGLSINAENGVTALTASSDFGTGISANSNTGTALTAVSMDGNHASFGSGNKVVIDYFGKITTVDNVQANAFIKTGGTSSQYLMADGSISTGPSLAGYVPTSRTLTINGTPYDLTADRSWSVGTVTGVTATSPITSSGGTAPVISTSMATNRLIGRSTAGTGVMEEITVGSGLSLSGGTLNATAQAVGFEQNFLLMGA